MVKLGNRQIPVIFIILMGMIVFIEMARCQEAAAPGSSQQEIKIEYKSEDLKDPFQEEKIEIQEEQQQEQEARPLPALNVQGIVWGGNLLQAIINNKVVRVGDTIEGARISDISQSGVTLFFGNRQYKLTPSSPFSSK